MMGASILRNLLLHQNMSTFLWKTYCLKGFNPLRHQKHYWLLSQHCSFSFESHVKSSVLQQALVIEGIEKHANNSFTVFQRNYSQQGDKNSPISVNVTATQSEESNSSDQDNTKKKSQFKKYAIIFICVTYGGMFLSILYNIGQPIIDEDGQELQDEFSHLPPLEQFFKRMFDRLYIFKEFLRRPSRERLLPDVHPLNQPKYTLVLEATHVLLYPDWTYQTGWRFKKRPNVDHFLEQLSSPLFEIVVFTSQAGANMASIIESLDKGAGGNLINYSLYRDATEFINGEHVKNLAHLNRDLAKVIIIDWNPNAVYLQPENALILPKWTGNDDDSTLVELVAFLKNVAEKSPEDVRQLLTHYKQFPDPMEQFRTSQRKLPELVS